MDLSLYPLDTLKTRLQSSQGFVRAGGFRGIYAGVGSALVGSAPGAALFFVSYESVKDALRTSREGVAERDGTRSRNGSEGDRGGKSRWWHEPVEHMAAASIGEIAACAVRVPTETVKQRAQALQGQGSGDVLRQILRRRTQIGVLGVWMELYRGWTITVIREVPFTVIQFPIWEALKASRLSYTDDNEISSIESGFFGSIAGAVAAGMTTPLDVLKTRLMLANEKQSAWSMARHIAQERGVKAFFSGVGPRTMWISIGGAVFLGSYQWAYNRLGGVANVQ